MDARMYRCVCVCLCKCLEPLEGSARIRKYRGCETPGFRMDTSLLSPTLQGDGERSSKGGWVLLTAQRLGCVPSVHPYETNFSWQ